MLTSSCGAQAIQCRSNKVSIVPTVRTIGTPGRATVISVGPIQSDLSVLRARSPARVKHLSCCLHDSRTDCCVTRSAPRRASSASLRTRLTQRVKCLFQSQYVFCNACLKVPHGHYHHPSRPSSFFKGACKDACLATLLHSLSMTMLF